MPGTVAAGPLRTGVPWQVSFLVLAAIWGYSFWWIKLGLRAVSAVDVAFLRLVAGALALAAVSLATRTPLPRSRRTWRHLFVAALLFNAAPFTLLAYGETHVASSLAAIVNALTPVAATVATFAVFREGRPSRSAVFGIVLGVAGIAVVTGAWRGLGAGQAPGVLACAGAVACYGIAFPYARRHLGGGADGPVALATGQVLCGAAQMLPFALLFGRVAAHPPATSLLALAALGALGSGVAYVLNFHVVRSTSATAASTVTYVVPVFAVLVGAVALGEPVTWFELAGGVLVLAAAALAQGRLGRRTVGSARAAG